MVKHKKIRTHYPFFKLVPSIVTLTSLCVGLSAIKFSFGGEFVKATIFLLIAGFLDGIDGRLARFLDSTTDFGAQLDSLVDFVNFGIVPGFLVYSWINSFYDVKGLDWAMVLFFAICASIRLARFNVDLTRESVNPILEKYFFKGIPAPVGAAVAILPMILYYNFGSGFYTNPVFVINYVCVIAVLMASKVPTISIKKIPIKNEYSYLTLMILIFTIIGLFVEPWITLASIALLYFISIPITIFIFIKIELTSKNHAYEK